MAGLGKGCHQIGETDRFRHGDDIRPGHADVACRALAEMEQVAEHLPLNRRKIALGRRPALMLVDRFLDLVAKRRFIFLAEEQPAQAAPQSSAAIGCGAATGIVWHGFV